MENEGDASICRVLESKVSLTALISVKIYSKAKFSFRFQAHVHCPITRFNWMPNQDPSP